MMNIPSQILVGHLHILNKNCIDWSSNGLISYGCQSIVVIYDPIKAKILQTLDNRKSIITCLRWSNTLKLNTDDNSIQVKLASGDDNGNVAIWDVCSGSLIHEFNESSNKQTPIKDLKWLSYMDSKIDYLLVLYKNNTLSLWNCDKFTKIWSKLFNENIFQVTLDHHIPSRIALLTNTCIMFIEDFSLNQAPQNSTRRFQISNMGKKSDESLTISTQQRRSSNWLGKLVETANLIDQKLQITAQTLNPQSQDILHQINDCLQIEFSVINKNILYVLFPKEIYIFDLVINQTVGYLTSDKSGTSFSQMYLCLHIDAIYCLYENSCLTLRYRSNGDETQSPYEFNYTTVANSDPIRLTKSSKSHGFCVSPTNERLLTISINDGRLVTYELDESSSSSNKLLRLINLIPHKNKFIMHSLFQNLPQQPFVIKYCPPMTKKNWSFYEPLLAVGDSNGDLYIYQMHLSNLWRKYTIHTHTIRGIEWASLNSLITWSNNSPNENGENGKQCLVKNEILFTDLKTGQSKPIRGEVTNEESPITSIKSSYLKQYFVILFKDQPLEIWDLKSFSLIRKLSPKMPIITILEWSPDIKKSVLKEDSDTTLKQQQQSKENFVCIDLNGFMYSFSIEGHTIKDGSKVSLADGSISNVSSIALKHDYIVFADSLGYLNICDFKEKTSKLVNFKKGPIRKLKFAPGKENLRLIILFNDSIEIYNLSKQETISTLRVQSLNLKIIDCDWCASDKPIVSMSDGCIRVYDINLKQIPNPLKSVPYFNCSTNYEQLNERLLGVREYQAFKYCLVETIKNSFSTKPWEDFFLNEAILKDNLKELCENLNNDTEKLLKSQSIEKIEKYCQIYSTIFPSDKFEYKFWSIVKAVLSDSPSNEIDSVFQGSAQFKDEQLRLIKLHEIKCSDYQQRKNLIGDLLFTNQVEKAFHLLIDTDQSNANYLNDYLRACLLSSLKDFDSISSSTKSSIKLVATNLIASGHVLDGAQLLTLIGLTFDACRYLQDANLWEKAAWLAKMRLNDEEISEIYKRWSETTKNKCFAVLLLLSTKQYCKALEMVSMMNDFSLLSYQFLEYCLEFKLIKIDDESNAKNTISRLISEKIYAKNAENVYLFDNMSSFKQLCSKAGQLGEELLSK